MNKTIQVVFVFTVAIVGIVNSLCYNHPATVTNKQTTFLSYPMSSYASKSVTTIPGIGSTYGGRLITAGYPTISDLFFRMYAHDKAFSENDFCDWLQSTADMSPYYATMTVDAFYLKTGQKNISNVRN